MNYVRVDICPHVKAGGCHLWKLDIAMLVWRCVWCACSITDQMMPQPSVQNRGSTPRDEMHEWTDEDLSNLRTTRR